MLSSVRATRRQLLRRLALAGAGVAGVVAAACGTAPAPVAPTHSSGTATPSWDAVLSAAKAEGKVVVSGPPDPGASTAIPDAFKQFSGIDMKTWAGNSTQLQHAIQMRRAPAKTPR